VSQVKEPWELAMMRHSGRRLAEVAAALRDAVRPGITTLELDALAESEVRKRGAVPSFKGYKVGPNTFRHTICASPNEQVVHGIPSDRPILSGDILSLDMGLVYGGYHSDCAFTVAVGEVDARIRQLLEATEQSLLLGVRQARAGNRIGDIGHAIQTEILPKGFGIVRDYVGHGIGRALHEQPSVPNFGKSGKGALLKEGMCLAIEPMINLGGEKTRVLADGWTVVTSDGRPSAHFEHTIAITARGPEILTVLDGGRIDA
jgi:methionyl aminopeptidase